MYCAQWNATLGVRWESQQTTFDLHSLVEVFLCNGFVASGFEFVRHNCLGFRELEEFEFLFVGEIGSCGKVEVT